MRGYESRDDHRHRRTWGQRRTPPRRKAGVPESEYVAKNGRSLARPLWDELGPLRPKEFIRTTDSPPRGAPYNGSSNFFAKNGYVYKGHYTGQLLPSTTTLS